MKQYIFVVNKPKQLDSKEIIIDATGMLDAFNQAKELKLKEMKESKSKIDLKLKGTIYSH
ncbi:hypothetical protein GH741_03070 [Aquibacillus halophilus]|uniref:DUF3906 family protein n=1 Tax=Aquibacillus halophilus TaxID=930132 RepID=A0A6A8D7C6_9BACI|nr:hypothetical protein [Aquibacillus halophilus]MRH41653.1 hypothetical protein [Aquibacillus halophilus]